MGGGRIATVVLGAGAGRRFGGRKQLAPLRRAGVETVECGDLGDPADVDTPARLAELEARGDAA